MIHRISIHELLSQPERVPIVDVRTPAEFNQGHIPGGLNLPLFTNEERVQVGTTYKQVGREAAILLGFELTGTKWAGFIRQALQIAPGRKLALHCWRGGMRSGAMAWALDLYGFEVYLLEGGYKRYRNWVLAQFDQKLDLLLIGGMTGSGKTQMLHELRAMGEQVIDLEDLAQHQGSTYGTLNRLVQPSQEQFENNLAGQLDILDPHRSIWLEDESSTIGKRLIPRPLWRQMLSSPVFEIRVPLEQRISKLENEYGSLDKEFLTVCTERIAKRLGPEQTRRATAAIREDRMKDFVRELLVYYDKTYQKGLNNRDAHLICPLELSGSDPRENAGKLIETSRSRTEKSPHEMI